MDRLRVFAQWIGLGALVGAAAGLASAAFLASLEWVTRFREGHHPIVFALPLAGLLLGWVYEGFGKSVQAGNNLVLDTLHEDRPQLPLRMAPLVLLGTVWTHLFGGSAGREGTAVQMAASLADEIAHRFRANKSLRRQLLAAGIAGGFGSVFGTPIAGTFFGLEVLAVGKVEYDALLPAVVAALVGDAVTRGLGIRHTLYPAATPLTFGVGVVWRWALFGVAVGLTSRLFVEGTHRLKGLVGARVKWAPLRPALGGAVVVLLWLAVGTDRYLGLGVPTIVAAYSDATMVPWTFALKLVFTVVTLGSGFIGGEVTPLFFIGATLGNALARPLGLPLELAAGVGMAALFGAAANAPIALCLMAVELLGGAVFPHVVLVTVIAYLVSGHRGIYPSQRVARLKHGAQPEAGPYPLREHH